MKKILGIFAISCLLFSCDKSDNVRPVLEEVTINDVHDYAYVETGWDFKFNFEITDNEKLKFVSVNAVKGFVGETNIDKAGNDLSYGNNFSYDSKKESGVGFINADATASGTYHLTFDAKDANENEALTRRVNFIYQNSNPGSRPFWEINNTSPEANGRFIYISRGNEIVVNAVATSVTDLKHIKIEMLNNNGQFLVLKKDLPGDNDLSFDLADFKNTDGERIPLYVPVTAPQGQMVLIITATDANNQCGIIYYNVNVSF